MARRFFFFFTCLLLGLSAVTALAQGAPVISWMPNDDLDSLRSALVVDPSEIDLGILAPGQEIKRTLRLRNAGPGNPEWFAQGPDEWTLSDGQYLSGIIGETPIPIKIHLAYVREVGTLKKRGSSLVLRLESGEQAVSFRREVPLGDLCGEVRFNYDGGTSSLFFRAILVEMPAAPQLDVGPLRMDFGTIRPGETITKRILLHNRGRESLRWQAGVAGAKGMPPAPYPPIGRYVSFGKVIAGTGADHSNGPGREGLEFSGNWEQEGGYPSAEGEQNVLRYRFTGTGIILCFWKSPDGGSFSVFLDEQLAGVFDSQAEHRERGEALIIEEQIEGPHLLTIVTGTGRLTLEGARIFGQQVQKGPRGWISVFPDSGFTTRETDYINIALRTQRLMPGIYGDHIFFTSNGGNADVEVFLEVAAEATPKFMEVHRYLAGSDYLYTTNPAAEAKRLQLKGYRHLGIAFRLFAPGTPGTTEFFRWFNPSKGDHYYSHDPKGDQSLAGYLFEGSIGNIATSRLTGTRELYRWFNPARGSHFFTTDEAGEGLSKKGYRFEGIAGFVR